MDDDFQSVPFNKAGHICLENINLGQIENWPHLNMCEPPFLH